LPRIHHSTNKVYPFVYLISIEYFCVQGDEGVSSLIRRLSDVQEKLHKSEERISELEQLLTESTVRLKATESKLNERDQLHAQLQKVSTTSLSTYKLQSF